MKQAGGIRTLYFPHNVLPALPALLALHASSLPEHSHLRMTVFGGFFLEQSSPAIIIASPSIHPGFTQMPFCLENVVKPSFTSLIRMAVLFSYPVFSL